MDTDTVSLSFFIKEGR